MALNIAVMNIALLAALPLLGYLANLGKDMQRQGGWPLHVLIVMGLCRVHWGIAFGTLCVSLYNGYVSS